MKFYLCSILSVVLMTLSCKDFGEQEAKTDVQEEPSTERAKDTMANEEIHYADTSLGTKQRKESVTLESSLGTDLDQWENRQTMRMSMDGLKKIPQENIPAITSTLKEDLIKMRDDIPVDDHTETVQRQFENVDTALDKLQHILGETGINEEKIYAQVDEVIDAYNKLEAELGIPVGQA
ncbi:MAG: hypothetical protein WBG71_04470 [Leeuwenhoekiella sp.]